MPLSKSDRLIVYFSMLPFDFISILGSLFIVLLYLLVVSLQKFPFKIIFVLSIFDLFHAIAFAIPTYNSDDKDILCQMQSIMLSFSTTAGILWTSYIAGSLYLIIVKNSSFPQKHFKFFLFTVLIISILMTLVPSITDTYGLAAGWCWISQNPQYDTKFYERYFLFFIPLWTSIALNTILFIFVSRAVRKTTMNQKVLISLNKKLKYYPIILVISFLPYTIKSIFEFLDNIYFERHLLELTIVAGIFRSIMGLLNAIVYGLTQRVRKALKLIFNQNSNQDKSPLIKFS